MNIKRRTLIHPNYSITGGSSSDLVLYPRHSLGESYSLCWDAADWTKRRKRGCSYQEKKTQKNPTHFIADLRNRKMWSVFWSSSNEDIVLLVGAISHKSLFRYLIDWPYSKVLKSRMWVSLVLKAKILELVKQLVSRVKGGGMLLLPDNIVYINFTRRLTFSVIDYIQLVNIHIE